MTGKLRLLKHALGGEISGRTLMTATIGHSSKDRGTSITDSPDAPDGLLVRVHNGNGRTDDLAAKDRALRALGISLDRRRHSRPIDPAEEARRIEARRRADAKEKADTAWRQRRAIAMWQEARDPRGTLVEVYLRSRRLDLPDEVAGDVLRFHQRCPWGEGATAPAMVAAMRCVRTGEITGIHRTALTPDGAKLGRKMFGVATGAAIMLDGEDTVATGLAIGEGIETCLAARQLGIRPTWALGSVGAIADFPVLDGIETLTVLAENDTTGASERACQKVGTRWIAAGRSADSIKPKIGTDMNDVLMGGAPECH